LNPRPRKIFDGTVEFGEELSRSVLASQYLDFEQPRARIVRLLLKECLDRPQGKGKVADVPCVGRDRPKDVRGVAHRGTGAWIASRKPSARRCTPASNAETARVTTGRFDPHK